MKLTAHFIAMKRISEFSSESLSDFISAFTTVEIQCESFRYLFLFDNSIEAE